MIVPEIRGGTTVMDRVFKAEDATGNASEHSETPRPRSHLKHERRSEKSWAVLDLNQ
jgi:hypothetical protein